MLPKLYYGFQVLKMLSLHLLESLASVFVLSAIFVTNWQRDRGCLFIVNKVLLSSWSVSVYQPLYVVSLMSNT